MGLVGEGVYISWGRGGVGGTGGISHPLLNQYRKSTVRYIEERQRFSNPSRVLLSIFWCVGLRYPTRPSIRSLEVTVWYGVRDS